MKLNVEAVVSAGNGRYCEDAVLRSANVVGVLDGATPIDDGCFENYASPAAWMVGEFVARFANSPLPVSDYPSVCKRIVSELGAFESIRKLPDCQKPCCTSAAFVVDEQELALRAYVIGDALLALLLVDGTVCLLEDERMLPYTEATMQAYRAGGALAARLQRVENLKMMNSEEGYWTVAFKGEFSSRFVERRFKVEDIVSVFACTDGYARLFSKGFDVTNVKNILDGSLSLAEGLVMLREVEASQADSMFLKHSDDAAAVIASGF